MHKAFDPFLSQEPLQIFQQTPGPLCGQIKKNHVSDIQLLISIKPHMLFVHDLVLKSQVTDASLAGDAGRLMLSKLRVSIKLCYPHELVKSLIRLHCCLNSGIRKAYTHIHPRAWQGKNQFTQEGR